MTGIVCALAGRSSGRFVLDTQSIVAGVSGGGALEGYRRSPALGTINDGTSDIYGGALINFLAWSVQYDPTFGYLTNNTVDLQIAGTLSNSGWTSMEANGIVYLRTDASFTVSGGSSYWSWYVSPDGISPGPSPFTTNPTVVRWY